MIERMSIMRRHLITQDPIITSMIKTEEMIITETDKRDRSNQYSHGETRQNPRLRNPRKKRLKPQNQCQSQRKRTKSVLQSNIRKKPHQRSKHSQIRRYTHKMIIKRRLMKWHKTRSNKSQLKRSKKLRRTDRRSKMKN